MSKTGFSITDWTLFLKGTLPWSFLIEVGIRVFFLYMLIIVAMRLIGRRMGAQLTRNEMAALVLLAATVGIPMQSPNQGLLLALLAAGVVAGLQRLIAWYAFRNARFEKLALDNIDILVKDGCLQMRTICRTTLSRELVVARLRGEGTDHLGKVQRLYIESNGAFSLRKSSDLCPGLSLYPEFDTDMLKRQEKVENCFACTTCGHLLDGGRPVGSCSECGKDNWTEAVMSA